MPSTTSLLKHRRRRWARHGRTAETRNAALVRSITAELRQYEGLFRQQTRAALTRLLRTIRASSDRMVQIKTMQIALELVAEWCRSYGQCRDAVLRWSQPIAEDTTARVGQTFARDLLAVHRKTAPLVQSTLF